MVRVTSQSGDFVELSFAMKAGLFGCRREPIQVRQGEGVALHLVARRL